MNLELPIVHTVGDFAALLGTSIATGARDALEAALSGESIGSNLVLAGVVLLAAVLTAALCSTPFATGDGPILTETDREAVR